MLLMRCMAPTLKMCLRSHRFFPSRVVGVRVVSGGHMNKTLTGVVGAHAIRELGSDPCFPAAGDPVPLEGTVI